jgi:hypothetical protein
MTEKIGNAEKRTTNKNIPISPTKLLNGGALNEKEKKIKSSSYHTLH